MKKSPDIHKIRHVKKGKSVSTQKGIVFHKQKKLGWEEMVIKNKKKNYRKRKHKINVSTIGIQILGPRNLNFFGKSYFTSP